MMKRALTLLQLMTLTQFGCGAHSHRFSSNELKKTPRGNHWGCVPELITRARAAHWPVAVFARGVLPCTRIWITDGAGVIRICPRCKIMASVFRSVLLLLRNFW